VTSNLAVKRSNPFRRANWIRDAMRQTALFLIVGVLTTGASAQTPEPVRHGRALLKEFCASCHAIGTHGRSPHVSAPPFRTLGRSFDLDEFPRQLERGISSDHPDMPTFKFSVDDANAVRAYLRTIQE
jgi:mono/diheme cytochrome c family protein